MATARRSKKPATTPKPAPATDTIVVYIDKDRESIRVERNGVNAFEAPKILEAAAAIANGGIGLAPADQQE